MEYHLEKVIKKISFKIQKNLYFFTVGNRRCTLYLRHCYHLMLSIIKYVVHPPEALLVSGSLYQDLQ